MKDILKERRRKRIAQKKKHLKKQIDIIKMVNYFYDPLHILQQPHRLHKMHATNCGDPNCVMCGNPRKFWNERTIQERRHDMNKKIDVDNEYDLDYSHF